MAKFKRNSDDRASRKFPWWKLAVTIIVLACAAIAMLDARLLHTISGRMWAQPAVIYARPLDIYEGAPISMAQLEFELRSLNYHAVANVSRVGEYSIGRKVTIFVRAFEFDDGKQAAQKIAFTIVDDVVQALEAREPILRLEPLAIGRISPSHKEDRLLVSIDDVPETLKAMLVASEDRAFYDHHGISLRGISRAFISNLKQGKLAQGGSTITQQLVKNYFLTSERTLSRKLMEVFTSLLLERHLSKQQILESYINEIYLAQNGPRAVHGFGLASQFFFDKPIEDLALHEQATLVALVRGPSFYNPYRQPERSLERRNLMLKLAFDQGYIDQTTFDAAQAQPLGVVATYNRKSQRMPAYLDLVKRELRQQYSSDDLSNSGLNVFTHFDPWVQHQAELAVKNRVASLGDQALQVASVVVAPESGYVLSLVGDKDPRYPGFNRSLDAKRHVGSLLKPALYLTALMQPEKYNLVTEVSDAPVYWSQPNGEPWQPENFDGESHGEMPLYKALAYSHNQAAARLGRELGMPALKDTLSQLNVELSSPVYPSTILGAIALSPFDVAQMYQVFAGGGFFAQLHSVRVVVSDTGEILSHNPLTFEARFAPEDIALLQFALNRVTVEGSGRSLARTLPNYAIAGKTGTSDDLKDSWFAGYSGDYLAVVWMGHDDNSATRFTGASGALRVWSELMAPLVRQSVALQQLDELVYMGFDDSTGQLAKAGCDFGLPVPFVAEFAPRYTVSCEVSDKFKSLKDRVFEWFRQ